MGADPCQRSIFAKVIGDQVGPVAGLTCEREGRRNYFFSPGPYKRAFIWIALKLVEFTFRLEFTPTRVVVVGGGNISEDASRLGVASRNAYARYERGDAVPTVEKLDELLKATKPGGELVLRASSVTNTPG